MLTRRTLLTAAGAASLLPLTGLRSTVFAAVPSANQPILIVLHLRGGCDGLNFVSPASDPDFIEARISELRVAADGPNAGYQLANGPAPSIDFRLHPAAGGLNELYKSGHLAFIHAAGLTNQTRSHFVATDMIERGVASDADLGRTSTGWITRALQGRNANNGAVPAVAASGTVGGDLDGAPFAMAIPDLSYGLAPAGGPQMASALWQLYGAPGTVAESGRTAMQTMAGLDARLPRDDQGKVKPYQAENGANYDPAGDFARPLKTVAQLIKMEVGLSAVTLDYGAWDHHEYQAGRFKPQVERLSNGLAAFWNDLSAYHDRITLVTLTEFGRRLRNNRSNGTDHGRGGLMMVLGGKVAGGRFHGAWPGLKSEQLDEAVDLAVANDYRAILGEILDRQHGVKAGAWFPNYKATGSLGVLA
jgi:uncharacterized protein (DUF1501 family)